MRNILTKAGILVLLLFVLLPAIPVAAGKHKAAPAAKPKARILFVPQDNRPTSCEQTADVVRKLGYDVVMPDKELLGGLKKRGNPERLCQWTKEQAAKADIAVVATDSLLYGGLVASRKHNTPLPVLQERAERLAELHRENPGLKLLWTGRNSKIYVYAMQSTTCAVISPIPFQTCSK